MGKGMAPEWPIFCARAIRPQALRLCNRRPNSLFLNNWGEGLMRASRKHRLGAGKTRMCQWYSCPGLNGGPLDPQSSALTN